MTDIGFAGGIGSAVSLALSEHPNIVIRRLFVPEVPHDGPFEELLDRYGINAASIIKEVKSITSSTHARN